MRIIDEKFKDSSPVETVNKINSLLAAHGLRVTEHWSYSDVANCYALRVTVDGTAFGTNGKGVTKELANASAHAELMERGGRYADLYDMQSRYYKEQEKEEERRRVMEA